MSKLFAIGIGPGDSQWMLPKARRAIQESSDLVGYGLYLDLLGDLGAGKERHDLPLGEETTRARLALDLAAAGKATALISSGDIGIYAMASVLFEMLDRQLQGHENSPAWLNVELEVIPGISAMQTAASHAGAMLGHDFCTISLSDLLTPWESIEKRIHSAGSADFVVSFYNPVSKKRSSQLTKARDILLCYRHVSTPVLIGRQLGRNGQNLEITTLAELSTRTVDMLTVVLVGNSESRHIVNGNRHWVYTPRGYSKKLI